MGTSLHTAQSITAKTPFVVRGIVGSPVSILLLSISLLLLGLIN